MKRTIFAFTIIFVFCNSSPGQTIYVDASSSGGNNGSGWTDAFNNLQDALEASYFGDEILVAEGIYRPDQGDGITPGDRESSFQLINGVVLRGGYAGFGERNPDACDTELYETILSGDLNGDDGPDFVNNDDNCSNIVTCNFLDASAILNGFTITGGGHGDILAPLGTAIRIIDGGPTIINCSFVDNFSYVAIYNHNSDSCFINCTIENSRMETCSHSRNNIQTITSCKFYNCIFDAIASFGMNMEISNCLFAGNLHGLFLDYSEPSVTVTNCTFTGNNYAIIFDGGAQAVVNNSIIWNNENLFYDGDGSVNNVTVSHCCIQDDWPGDGNICIDPLFVDPANGDYHLLRSSLCVDAGSNSAVDPTTTSDLDGNIRILDGDGDGTAVVDMGAYEFVRVIETNVRVSPRVINRKNRGRYLLAVMQLPETVWEDDIDQDSPFVIYPGGLESSLLHLSNLPGNAKVFIQFNRAELLDTIEDNGMVELTVTGSLKTDQSITGSDTIRIIDK